MGQLEVVGQDLIAVSASPTPARVSFSVNGRMMLSCQKQTKTHHNQCWDGNRAAELLALTPPLLAV